MNKSGFISIAILIFNISIIFIIILFATMFMLKQTVYLAVTNIKQDMYSINRSAITLLSKKEEKYDLYSINKENYKQYLQEMLIKNYNLDSNLQNGSGFIKEIKVIDYNYLYGKNIEPVIQAKLEVGIRAPLFSELLKDNIYIEIVENTKVKKIRM